MILDGHNPSTSRQEQNRCQPLVIDEEQRESFPHSAIGEKWPRSCGPSMEIDPRERADRCFRQIDQRRNPIVAISFPNESAEYRAARDDLLEQELRLRRATESVAEARRALPEGGEVTGDYPFERIGTDGQVETVRLADLFSPGKTTLAIYSFMYGPERETPCPGCTSLLAQLDGGMDQTTQAIDFVVAARSPIGRIQELAKLQGWTGLRFISTASTTYNLDYHGTTPDEFDLPMLNVFHKEGGTVRHFWGAEMLYAPSDEGQDARAVDILSPLWNMLDLTPEGRGTTWWPEVSTPEVAVGALAG